MNYKMIFFLFLAVVSIISLNAEERIAGTLGNVDLIAIDLLNDEGHNHGESYYVYNRNSYPMRISVQLADGENIEDHLIDYTIIVKPHARAELGSIHQKELSKIANWNYDWKAIRDN